jgi:hypothetical protein
MKSRRRDFGAPICLPTPALPTPDPPFAAAAPPWERRTVIYKRSRCLPAGVLTRRAFSLAHARTYLGVTVGRPPLVRFGLPGRLEPAGELGIVDIADLLGVVG